MKERLLQLLDMEHLTPSKFADLIGVQRSSVSHILSGRNKPSFDFLQKTLSTFTGLKADWLMLGEGLMYEQMGRESGDLFDQPIGSAEGRDLTTSEKLETGLPSLPGISKDQEKVAKEPDTANESRKIVQVMLFYDDDTFITYKPSE